VAKGRLTSDDCNKVLKPLIGSSLQRHEKVRLYYEIDCRFPGAAWANLRLGIENIPEWERVAVVTDVCWLREAINVLRFLIQAEVRVFSTSDASQGRAWISSLS
jgi:SpoIIAA-like